jgi:succinate dehydrogenase hydrophobic anchor subunit
LYVNYKKYILPSSLDILHPILYSRSIVDLLFGFLTETEDLEQVIRKHPLHITLMDILEEARLKVPKEGQGVGASLLPILERFPILSRYAKTRGWFYVISWLHRFAGVWLFVALMVHLYTLSSWQTPGVFNTDLKIPVLPIFVFLAWASSLVVSFHALNGGRLILYELFGQRSDDTMIRWTFSLSVTYAAIVGLLMIMKNQSMSALFFWLMTFCTGAIAAYVVASRIWKKRHSVLWKLQRISGAFLFITVPAYLLFSYLNPGEANAAQGVLVRMQNIFTRLVTLTLAISALYHAGYGLFSIAADYTYSRITRAGMTALIVLVIAMLAVFAFRLIFSV